MKKEKSLSNGQMARERQTIVTFFLVILTIIILIFYFIPVKHEAYSFIPLSLKVSISTSWNFVPTKNCPEYGVKAQEIPSQESIKYIY